MSTHGLEGAHRDDSRTHTPEEKGTWLPLVILDVFVQRKNVIIVVANVALQEGGPRSCQSVQLTNPDGTWREASYLTNVMKESVLTEVKGTMPPKIWESLAGSAGFVFRTRHITLPKFQERIQDILVDALRNPHV